MPSCPPPSTLGSSNKQQHGLGSQTTVCKERAATSGLMAAEPPCLAERAEGDMSEVNVKRDKKKNKKEGKKKKEVEAETKVQEQPCDATTVENLVEVGGKQSSKPKKSKRERDDAGGASDGDQAMAREDKKSKKEHPTTLEENNQKQAIDSTVENTVAKGDKVEGKQSSKSKKSKSKRGDAGEASGSDQAVTREDKKVKKKHPVVLEESSQPKKTSEVENGEIKERGKEDDKSIQACSENASAGGEEADGDGKNDKKKKKSNEGTEQEGIKEKEKASQSKSKGKRVSFADSTEVFETKGGDGEGIEGGKKKKKKAAQPKNKGKRVSFADSVKVFEVGDGEGTEGGKQKKIKAAQSKKKGKWVSFADSAEVFETEGGDNEEGGSSDKSEFVHGVRFTPDEDATLMEAITNYIEMKQLGEKGLEMIRNARKHKKELMHCWDVIGKSLPHRPHTAVYRRALILLNRSDERGWTEKEKDHIRNFVQNNGTDWKALAKELGKCNIHVKDAWRRIKSPDLRKGYWTQDEHQKLFDLVNLDLRMKAHENKNPDNRKLRDNISWEAISDKLTTRNHKNCCIKWYDTLASPMVRKGIWADVDDYLLVEALQKDDAVCIEDVDWDSLLDHRSGELCRQRWNQMVRGLGGHREKPFIEQVDVLSGRYCPEMIEYRKDSEETPAGDANDDNKKKKSKESEEEPGAANAKVKNKKKKKSKESEEEPGAGNTEVEKNKKKKNKESEEEPGVANAEVEKKKKKSKESEEEPRVANAEVKKKKKTKSKESEEEPSAANAEVKKKKKIKSKGSEEEPGVANAEVEKKKKKKSRESEEPGASSAEVEKKKKKKPKESEEPGAANAEVEKKEKNKSNESEERGAANAEIKKKKKMKSKDSEEPDAKVEKKKKKKKTVGQDDEYGSRVK